MDFEVLAGKYSYNVTSAEINRSFIPSFSGKVLCLGLVGLLFCAQACKLNHDALGEDPILEPFPAQLSPALLIFFIHLN